MYTSEDMVSRFITLADQKETHMVYELPEAWWSRPYEYIWASKFAAPDDVVLDVACGICHPLKFHLGTIAKTVYACDRDPRILSTEAILQDIQDSVSIQARNAFETSLYRNVHLQQSDMTLLPYEDLMFNKVFCISVLEHVDETTQLQTLVEFARVLKDDGLVILTVDYPQVNMNSFIQKMDKANLRFAGDYDTSIPLDAISTIMWGPELKCIRLLLCKNR